MCAPLLSRASLRDDVPTSRLVCLLIWFVIAADRCENERHTQRNTRAGRLLQGTTCTARQRVTHTILQARSQRCRIARREGMLRAVYCTLCWEFRCRHCGETIQSCPAICRGEHAVFYARDTARQLSQNGSLTESTYQYIPLKLCELSHAALDPVSHPIKDNAIILA